MKRQHQYTENAIHARLKETINKLKAEEEDNDHLNLLVEKLQKENKTLVQDNSKLEERVKSTVQIKEHEERMSHLKVKYF